MDYNYSNSIDYSTSSSAGSLGATLLLMYFVFFIVMYVFIAVCAGRIFKKAGVPYWQAWVPFLNTWKMLELGGQQGFWAILTVIPVVNIISVIFILIAMYYIGKKLGKDDAFILLAIFVPIVWYPWLAFDHSTWDDSKGTPRRDSPMIAPPTAPIATPTMTTPEQPEQPTDQNQTPPTAPTL